MYGKNTAVSRLDGYLGLCCLPPGDRRIGAGQNQISLFTHVLEQLALVGSQRCRSF
jgi:hypothetical protein